MHKKLEADLISLAHSILQMKNRDDVFALEEKAKVIVSKLSMLAFVETYVNTTPNLKETKEELIFKIEKAFENKNLTDVSEEIVTDDIEINKEAESIEIIVEEVIKEVLVTDDIIITEEQEEQEEQEEEQEEQEEEEQEEEEEEDLPNKLSINEYVKDIECKHKNHEVRENDLNSLFTDKLYEFFFDIDNDKICSFELMLFILKHNNSSRPNSKIVNMNINELKNILIEEYFNNEYTEALLHAMLEINKKLYKEDSAGSILLEKLKISPFLKIEEFKKLLSDLINSPMFFVTYIDIYLIAKKYNLPIILICNTVINLSINDKTFIILNKNTQNNNYYSIKIPSKYIKTQKNYKLLHFSNTTTIDITKNTIDNDKIQINSDILLQLENYTDLILNLIIESNKKKVVPKDKKLKANADLN